MVADVSLSWLVEMCADKSHWDWKFQSIAVYDSIKKKKKKAIVVKSKSWSGDLAMFCASQVSLSPHTEHLTGSQETFNTAFHMGD